MPSALQRAVLSALLAALASGPAAADGLLQAGPDLLLYPTSAGHRLESGGRPLALPLPAGARVADLVGHGAGWLLAGTEERGQGRSLLLMTDAGGTLRRMAAPSTAGPLAVAPTLLGAGGELAAMAWLEGDDPGKLGVRAALWTGEGWAQSETVSPPGPGSQLALAGAVLPDGRPMVAWVAFDGQDDEILWTVAGPQGWSTPQRLGGDNPVPDVLPALLPLADGALAAWSRYDGGDYRLVVARWAEGAWDEPRMVGGAGTVEVSAVELGGEAAGYLVYRAVGEDAWHLLEVGAEGELLRIGAVPVAAGREGRPAVAVTAGDVELRWPLAGRSARPLWRGLAPQRD